MARAIREIWSYVLRHWQWSLLLAGLAVIALANFAIPDLLLCAANWLKVQPATSFLLEAQPLGAVAGFVVVLIILWRLTRDARDQEMGEVARAWSTIATGSGKDRPRNIGVTDALEQLHRHGRPLTRIGLSHVDLLGVHLRPIKGRKADLTRSTFYACAFDDADLSDTVLQKIRFDGFRFHGARFENADLTNAKFEHGSAISKTPLKGARFAGAVISGAEFHSLSLAGVDLSEARFDPKRPPKFTGGCNISRTTTQLPVGVDIDQLPRGSVVLID